MYLIRQAEIYSPEYLGKMDILTGGREILRIAEHLPVQKEYGVEEIDGRGKVLFPGLIDSHVHILGGGGEGGPKTRTPEIMLTDITMAGVTAVAGLLGTDGCTRTMTNLLAKAKGLEDEGITTVIYTGSYQVPVRTLTGSIMDDIILLDRVIGTGEIALSDHRSSQPTREEFARIAADTRVGGILSGKAGLVNIHMGDGEEGLEFLRYVAEKTQISFSNLLPTHIGRNEKLLAEGFAYAKKGGFIDLTTSGSSEKEKELTASCAFARALLAGVSEDHVSFSSDGQGSLPVFDEKGNFVGLGVGKVLSLYEEFRKCVLEQGMSLETALKPVTSTPAMLLKLEKKGNVRENADADLVLADRKTLAIDMVMAKGRIMVKEGKPVVRGTFEKI